MKLKQVISSHQRKISVKKNQILKLEEEISSYQEILKLDSNIELIQTHFGSNLKFADNSKNIIIHTDQGWHSVLASKENEKMDRFFVVLSSDLNKLQLNRWYDAAGFYFNLFPYYLLDLSSGQSVPIFAKSFFKLTKYYLEFNSPERIQMHYCNNLNSLFSISEIMEQENLSFLLQNQILLTLRSQKYPNQNFPDLSCFQGYFPNRLH